MSERRLRLDPGLTRLDASSWVAPGAVVLGDVHLGPQVSVWYGSVVRGDVEAIRIGARSNIQDLCVIHADPGFPVTIGEDVTVGHRAILHGATIDDGALIGMGAILLNGAHIGAGCLVAAGALVPGGKVFPPGTLIMGSPARAVKSLGPEEQERLKNGAKHYVQASQAHLEAGFGVRGGI